VSPARAGLAPAPIPYAESLVVLGADAFATLARAVACLHRVAHGPAWAALVDEGAGEVARHRPGNTGVFMGFDFHVTREGPRLIEINTNAGGGLLSARRVTSRLDPAKLACLCAELLPLGALEERIVASFRRELAAVRGPGAPLTHVAIVDDRPEEQFLREEFALVAALLERHGSAATVADTRELARDPAGRVSVRGRPVDLVYLRDTDFLLESERTRVLREAYLEDAVAVTPAPREHHLLANKARLTLFSDAARLVALGLPEGDARFLAEVVPPALPLAELGLEAAWRTRRQWVFKPLTGFASRGVYRGDKISRRRLEAIAAEGLYLAQRRVEPGELEVETAEGRRRMKFDVRAYAYAGEILLLGARVYQGQVTNLRTPGGGFSAICVMRGAAAGRRA
jgi:hypothetical protein